MRVHNKNHVNCVFILFKAHRSDIACARARRQLPSTPQYTVLHTGHGQDHPQINAPCECHYEGRSASNYPDGPKFDSSYDRGSPATFAPNQVIKGWTEAMQMMVEVCDAASE